MKISIVITSFNYSEYLNRAIRSALNQNFPVGEFEVIVIDDNSSDISKSIIKSFGRYIRCFNFSKNFGLSKARNKGIEMSNGQLIVFLDADDYFSRNLILIENEFLQANPNWQAVSCDYYKVDENERSIKYCSSRSEPIICGIMFRKKALNLIGGFDERFHVFEDKDFFNRFDNQIQYIELPLYRYRQHASSLTRNVKIIEKHEKLLNQKY